MYFEQKHINIYISAVSRSSSVPSERPGGSAGRSPPPAGKGNSYLNILKYTIYFLNKNTFNIYISAVSRSHSVPSAVPSAVPSGGSAGSAGRSPPAGQQPPPPDEDLGKSNSYPILYILKYTMSL